MNDTPEYRNLIVPVTFQHAERAEGEPPVLTGYAAVFDQVIPIGKYFREVVRRGAFTKTLENDDIFFLGNNHDKNVPLARTQNQTLRMFEDEHGLGFELELPPTQYASDLHVLVKRGIINKMSFGFTHVQERWTKATETETALSELLEVRLWDVSPVTWAAYPMTDVKARELYQERCAQRDVPSLEPPAAEADTGVDYLHEIRTRQLQLARVE